LKEERAYLKVNKKKLTFLGVLEATSFADTMFTCLALKCGLFYWGHQNTLYLRRLRV